MTTQEEKEDQKKQKQIEQVKKILTTASRAAASRTTDHTPSLCITTQSASKSTTDIVVSAPSVAGTSSRVSPGSKRNFTNGVSSVSKRPRVMGRQSRGRNTLRLHDSVLDAEGRGSSRANLEHLLAVAEVSTRNILYI